MTPKFLSSLITSSAFSVRKLAEPVKVFRPPLPLKLPLFNSTPAMKFWSITAPNCEVPPPRPASVEVL
ncbi:hypothetical protein C0208_03525 [Moraxella catarrhalis]|nr:hypothetical protein [Moraxella catarrhalis]